jgi:hypothetical protein
MKPILLICIFSLMVSGQSVAAKQKMTEPRSEIGSFTEAASGLQSMLCLNHTLDLALEQLYIPACIREEPFCLPRITQIGNFAGFQCDTNWLPRVKEFTGNYRKPSLLVPLKKYIETDTAADIRVHYVKLLKDSSHYYCNPDEINEYCTTLFKTKLTTVIQLLNETHRFFPKAIETTLLLAEAYEQAGDKYMSRQMYEETLALKPDHTVTYIVLKKIASLTKQD